MRSLSATYVAAQNALSKTPYFKLLFKRTGESDVDLSSDNSTYGNRLIYLDHQEESYNGYATIIFRNKDRDIPLLKGRYLEIGYGYETGAGKEYLGDSTNEPAPPRLWVKHQQTISANGKLWELLELEDMWTILRETLLRVGSPPLYTASYTTDTIYDILAIILGEIDPAMTLEALAEDDGIIDSLQPQFDINAQPFEYADAVMYRLLNMTASYLKPLDELRWEIKFPQDDDAVDITFYNYQAPYFYEYMERRNILIPNHIYVFGNAGDDGLWTSYLTGEAKAQSEIDAYSDIIKVVLAGSLTTQDQVDDRAGSQLARARFEQVAGRLVAPNNSYVEMYDRIAVVDTRGEADVELPEVITYIYNVDDLQAMANDLTANYALANDIDASATSGWNGGAGFDPIGGNFTGKLYGRNRKITNLYINRQSDSGIGLFSSLVGATVRDLTIEDAYIVGRRDVGVLAGYIGGGTTYNVHVSGEVQGITSSSDGVNGGQIGGLVGSRAAYGTLSCCSADVTVSSSGTIYDAVCVGGFIGKNVVGNITDCFATGNVTRSDGGRGVGGFIGRGGGCYRCYATGDVDGHLSWGCVGGFTGGGITAAMYDCFSTGAVWGTGYSAGIFGTGGFSGGFCKCDRCYSTGAVSYSGGSSTYVGGFIGQTGGTITACFWDIETSGWGTSYGGTGKTTADMKIRSTFEDAGWDFASVWQISEAANDGYPNHIWQCYGVQWPSDSMARVSAIRRIFKPGLYRMELGIGDLGIDIDVVDMGVKKIVEGVEEEETPGEVTPEVPTPTKIFTPQDWGDVIVQQAKEGWIVPNANVPGIAPNLPIGATHSTLEKPLNIQPNILAKLTASTMSRASNVNLFIDYTALAKKSRSQRTLAENIRYDAIVKELRSRGYALQEGM